MTTQTHLEDWNSGNQYEFYMGRWSRLIAREFLNWLNIPPNQEWLDVGCGTGALTQTVLDVAAPARLQGIDPSSTFIQFATQHIPQASFSVAGATELPYEPQTFDVVVSGLALNFIPDQLKALSEMQRVTKSGGTVAIYVWDYAGKMEWLRYFWDAALAVDPNAKLVDEGQRFPICKEQPLQELFQASGLKDIHITALDITTPFNSFDDYWQPFSTGSFPAPQYLNQLSKAQQAAIRQHLEHSLPMNNDGSLALIARAWAIRGNTHR